MTASHVRISLLPLASMAIGLPSLVPAILKCASGEKISQSLSRSPPTRAACSSRSNRSIPSLSVIETTLLAMQSLQHGPNVGADDLVGSGRVWNECPHAVEQVNHTRVTPVEGSDAGPLQALGIRLALIAQRIELRGMDAGRRQMAHIERA